MNRADESKLEASDQLIEGPITAGQVLSLSSGPVRRARRAPTSWQSARRHARCRRWTPSSGPLPHGGARGCHLPSNELLVVSERVSQYGGVNLSDWAEHVGVSMFTAYRLLREGTLPARDQTRTAAYEELLCDECAEGASAPARQGGRRAGCHAHLGGNRPGDLGCFLWPTLERGPTELGADATSQAKSSGKPQRAARTAFRYEMISATSGFPPISRTSRTCRPLKQSVPSGPGS